MTIVVDGTLVMLNQVKSTNVTGLRENEKKPTDSVLLQEYEQLRNNPKNKPKPFVYNEADAATKKLMQNALLGRQSQAPGFPESGDDENSDIYNG